MHPDPPRRVTPHAGTRVPNARAGERRRWAERLSARRVVHVGPGGPGSPSFPFRRPLSFDFVRGTGTMTRLDSAGGRQGEPESASLRGFRVRRTRRFSVSRSYRGVYARVFAPGPAVVRFLTSRVTPPKPPGRRQRNGNRGSLPVAASFLNRESVHQPIST